VFDDVGHIDVGSIDSGLFERAFQKLARGPTNG
jgi:hypothetical protein